MKVDYIINHRKLTKKKKKPKAKSKQQNQMILIENNRKLLNLYLFILIITFKINGLNSPLKGREYQVVKE